jgi:hypothetical protein
MMAIAHGARFNHYEILSPLGAGGMAGWQIRTDYFIARGAILSLFAN